MCFSDVVELNGTISMKIQKLSMYYYCTRCHDIMSSGVRAKSPVLLVCFVVAAIVCSPWRGSLIKQVM